MSPNPFEHGRAQNLADFAVNNPPASEQLPSKLVAKVLELRRSQLSKALENRAQQGDAGYVGTRKASDLLELFKGGKRAPRQEWEAQYAQDDLQKALGDLESRRGLLAHAEKQADPSKIVACKELIDKFLEPIVKQYERFLVGDPTASWEQSHFDQFFAAAGVAPETLIEKYESPAYKIEQIVFLLEKKPILPFRYTEFDELMPHMAELGQKEVDKFVNARVIEQKRLLAEKIAYGISTKNLEYAQRSLKETLRKEGITEDMPDFDPTEFDLNDMRKLVLQMQKSEALRHPGPHKTAMEAYTDLFRKVSRRADSHVLAAEDEKHKKNIKTNKAKENSVARFKEGLPKFVAYVRSLKETDPTAYDDIMEYIVARYTFRGNYKWGEYLHKKKWWEGSLNSIPLREELYRQIHDLVPSIDEWVPDAFYRIEDAIKKGQTS